MGLFDGIFGNNADEDFENEQEINRRPALTLAFDDLPQLKPNQIKTDIGKLERSSIAVSIEKSSNGKNFSGFIEFRNHKINFVAVNDKIPVEVLNAIFSATIQWDKKYKEELLGHKTHILCYYDGQHPNPVEQYIALYKVAYAFSKYKLLGIVNEQAYTWHPAGIVTGLGSREVLNECRTTPPLMLWTGFIELEAENGTCYFTKGNSIFGINDFAYLGTKGEADEVRALFTTIFNYIYETKATIEAGHTMQIDKTIFLKFKSVELKQFSNTLVIERIPSPDLKENARPA